MSTKQMAYAALGGRLLRFHLSDAVINGYLVGMDDYHWLVAQVDEDGKDIHTDLLHKGSVTRVRISREDSLSNEDLTIKAAVQSIGGSFFDFCADLLDRPKRKRDNQ